MSGTSSTSKAPKIDAAKRDLFIACRNLNAIILLGLRSGSQVSLCPTRKALEESADGSSTLRSMIPGLLSQRLRFSISAE